MSALWPARAKPRYTEAEAMVVSARLSPPPSVDLRRAVATKKLVLRSGPSLSSQRLGDIVTGKELVVMELVDLATEPLARQHGGAVGDVRARVGKDSTPRGIALVPLGWVTAVKDGEDKLEEVLPSSSASAGPSHSMPMRSYIEGMPPPMRMPPPLDMQRDVSMAASIARRRRERRGVSSGRALGGSTSAGGIADATRLSAVGIPPSVEVQSVHEADELPPSPPPPQQQQRRRKSARPVEVPLDNFLSSRQLSELAESQRARATEVESTIFDTLETKLGLLIMQRSIKVDALMKEWDINGDGSLSKHEFRVNARKLGITEHMAPIRELDALFDSLDEDGGGELDVTELARALKRLRTMVSDVKGQYAYTAERAEVIRGVAETYDMAAHETLAHESGIEKLEELRQGTVASRLGDLLKNRNIKVSDMAESWDKDKSGEVDLSEFKKGARDLGFTRESDVGLNEVFATLDKDGSGCLSIHELIDAMKSLQYTSMHAKNAIIAQEKHLVKSRRAAEKAQLKAAAALEAAEARHEAALAAQAAEAEARVAAEEAKQREVAQRKALEARRRREDGINKWLFVEE